MIFWKWKTNDTRVLPPLGVTDRQHQGRAANLPVVATMSVCGANERTFSEGRGPANDSCRDSVVAPKTRTSDQIVTDQIPTTEPCMLLAGENSDEGGMG